MNLAAVASEKAVTISLSDRLGARVLVKNMESVNPGECWTIFIYTRMLF